MFFLSGASPLTPKLSKKSKKLSKFHSKFTLNRLHWRFSISVGRLHTALPNIKASASALIYFPPAPWENLIFLIKTYFFSPPDGGPRISLPRKNIQFILCHLWIVSQLRSAPCSRLAWNVMSPEIQSFIFCSTVFCVRLRIPSHRSRSEKARGAKKKGPAPNIWAR